MYEVYSQQRPGRPQWTLVANAFVLLLTVGLAAGVAHYKDRALRVPLGEEQIYERGRLRCALPEGWEVMAEQQPRDGLVLTAREPSDRGRRRELLIFRENPHLLGIPSQSGGTALLNRLSALNRLEGVAGVQGMQFSRIGDLPAFEIAAARRVGGAPDNPNIVSTLGRAALGPGGEIVSILLLLPDTFQPVDRVLMDQVASRLKLLDVDLENDTAAAMKTAGIQWEMPGDVRVFQETIPHTNQLRLAGGEERAFWYLSAFRVPLLEGRTPEALLRDFYLHALEVTKLPDPVRTETAGERTLATLHFAIGGERSKSVLLACAQTDAETALLLIGRHEEKGFDRLYEICRDLAGGAQVVPYSREIELAAGLQRAERWLADVRAEGLKRVFGDVELRHQRFRLRAPAMELGDLTRRLTAVRRGAERWWELFIDLELEGSRYKSIEEWHLRDDLKAYTYELRQVDDRHSFTYTEEWEGEGEVLRSLRGRSIAGYDRRTPVNPVFTTDPLFIAAAADLSGRGASGAGLIVSITYPFVPDLCYWTLRPLGRRPLPDGSGQSADAVLAQRDYNPWPILLLFDEDRELLAIDMPGGRYQIRTGNSSRTRETE